eukprot:s1890_g15.t1
MVLTTGHLWSKKWNWNWSAHRMTLVSKFWQISLATRNFQLATVQKFGREHDKHLLKNDASRHTSKASPIAVEFISAVWFGFTFWVQYVGLFIHVHLRLLCGILLVLGFAFPRALHDNRALVQGLKKLADAKKTQIRKIAKHCRGHQV